jgi:hypothetical protein
MVIWCTAFFLEALLLARGLQTKLVRWFPIFYSYILFVLLEELLRFAVYRTYPNHYAQVYWITQFLGLLIGSAIIFEIYRVGLARFPGTARMARYLLLVVFGAVFAKALLNSSHDLFFWLATTSVGVERNLRIVQEVAILALLSLFWWYAIPFGRKLKGILLGYSLFVGVTILQFTLLPHFHSSLAAIWPYAQPICYVAVLGLWLSALWCQAPIRGTATAMQLEDDYQTLAASTRTQLERVLLRFRLAARL